MIVVLNECKKMIEELLINRTVHENYRIDRYKDIKGKLPLLLCTL